MRQAPDQPAAVPPAVKSPDWVFSPDPVLESLTAKTRAELQSLFPENTERMVAFLQKIGNPHQKLPPVFHVAGTNGKGSTLAFLQAILEAGGMSVHKYIGPHLVRFEERIVLNGRDIDSGYLADLIRECRAMAGTDTVSFFEFFTGLAYLAFSRKSADAVLVETGVGGLNDATNVFDKNVVSVLTRISFDHMHVLGPTLADIARHKAGIIRQGCPVVAAPQPDEAVVKIFREKAASCDVALHDGWKVTALGDDRFTYKSDQHVFTLPLPRLKGYHQIVNAGTAIAAIEKSCFAGLLRQDILEKAMQNVEWQGRLQRLTEGPLLDLLPQGTELWLDGAHNDSGAEILLPVVKEWKAEGPLHIVTAHKHKKEPAAFYGALLPYADSVTTLGDNIGEYMLSSAELCDQLGKLGFKNASAAENLESALKSIAFSFKTPKRILVTGSLYLVGNALKRNA